MYKQKIKTKQELINISEDVRSKNKKIVFTNGCFDILHIGHVRYLEIAKSLGDILIVAINSDVSVKKLKGDDRPINIEDDRIEIISALEFVDYTVLFGQDTPIELITEIKPDVLVKGGDYKKEDVVGYDVVENNGGRVVIIPLEAGKSTTRIISRIMT